MRAAWSVHISWNVEKQIWSPLLHLLLLQRGRMLLITCGCTQVLSINASSAEKKNTWRSLPFTSQLEWKTQTMSFASNSEKRLNGNLLMYYPAFPSLAKSKNSWISHDTPTYLCNLSLTAKPTKWADALAIVVNSSLHRKVVRKVDVSRWGRLGYDTIPRENTCSSHERKIK